VRGERMPNEVQAALPSPGHHPSVSGSGSRGITRDG
jgi:hypothetical protein